MSASRRWLTARPSASIQKPKANTFARPADAGSTVTPRFKLDPQPPGTGYEFVNDIVGGSVPKEFIKPIDQGIQEALEGGILAGYPMVDVKATLYDGSYHDVDSNEMAFKIAGSMAFKEAARKASPVLLEPVMAVEVVTPEDYAGAIMGDLSSRRGRIEGMEHRAGSQVIKAIVPLAEMFGYATHMRLRPKDGRNTRCTLRGMKKCRARSRRKSSARCRAGNKREFFAGEGARVHGSVLGFELSVKGSLLRARG